MNSSVRDLPQIVDIYAIPEVYDVLHAPGTARDVSMCLSAARRFASGPAASAREWVEPACGSGRYVRALAGRGCDAVGVDLSEGMIEYARQRSTGRARARGKTTFVTGDMCSLDRCVGRKKFDAALNLINSVRHLESDARLARHLESTAAALRPGGVYIVGVSTAMYGHETPTEDVWHATRGRMKVTQVIQYEPPTATRGPAARVEHAYSHITVQSPTGSREYVSRYKLRCYSRRQWLDAINQSPLRLAAVINESGKEIDIPELGYGIYVLRRPV
ncbi:MAG: hypothetical protein AMXMBFR58_21060 [Phycisphaerae bacterium]